VANGNGKGKKKRRWLYIGIVLLLLIVGVGVTVAFTRGGGKIDPSKLAKVEKGDLAKSVVATGKIEPITKVEVKSKASGIVKKLYIDAGEKVKAGQLLAELDKEEIQARVNQAEAALQAAKANVERSEVDAQGPDVPLLKRAYERAQNMAKEGVVSQANLDDAQRNYEIAVNKQNMAKASLSQSKAQVRQNQATLDELQQQYRNATIISPMDGIALSRDVEVGDAVSSILVLGSSATLIMTLGDTSEVYVKGKVDESDIAKVYLGQPARIKVESFKDKTFNGKVTKISPLGVEKDNVTTFEVRVSVTNDKGDLKAAMTANAEIILEEHKGTLIIPEGALIYDKDKNASVEVPDPHGQDGKRKVAVKVGVSNGAKTEVLSGLKQGDQVIVQ
jgi:HlyD family secretion protein